MRFLGEAVASCVCVCVFVIERDRESTVPGGNLCPCMFVGRLTCVSGQLGFLYTQMSVCLWRRKLHGCLHVYNWVFIFAYVCARGDRHACMCCIELLRAASIFIKRVFVCFQQFVCVLWKWKVLGSGMMKLCFCVCVGESAAAVGCCTFAASLFLLFSII